MSIVRFGIRIRQLSEARQRRPREYSIDLAELDELTCLEEPGEDDDATIAGDEEVVFTVSKHTYRFTVFIYLILIN